MGLELRDRYIVMHEKKQKEQPKEEGPTVGPAKETSSDEEIDAQGEGDGD